MGINGEDLLEKALLFSCKKCKKNRIDFLRMLLNGSHIAHRIFRYELAGQLCDCLAEVDDNLEAVYIYGSTMEDNANFVSDIDLILKVKTKTKKTVDIITMYNNYLLNCYKNLIKEKTQFMNRLLDVHIIDESDIKIRNEYGALLLSMYHIPVKIWRRSSA